MKEYQIESYQDGELLVERKSIELHNSDINHKERIAERANQLKG